MSLPLLVKKVGREYHAWCLGNRRAVVVMTKAALVRYLVAEGVPPVMARHWVNSAWRMITPKAAKKRKTRRSSRSRGWSYAPKPKRSAARRTVRRGRRYMRWAR